MNDIHSPTVSVIVPCFNSELTIRRALNSILSQTYKDLEVIVIDDCSTDDTWEIINSEIRGLSNFKLIRLKYNSGAGVARSEGMRHARGRYIAFLDADDRWHPNKLFRQMQIFEDEPDTLIVHTGYNILDAEPRIVGSYYPPSRLNGWVMHFSNFIATSTAVFKADLNGAAVMPSIRARQDYAFWIRLLILNKGSVRGLNEVLCDYYKTPGSVSSSPLKNLINNYKMFAGELGYSMFKSIFFVSSNVFFWFYKKLNVSIKN